MDNAALRPLALVRGANDVASAAALRLMEAGYAVLLVESATPAVTRRGQSFADAAFDGTASLEGVLCRRVDTAAAWARGGAHDLALTTQPWEDVRAALAPEVLVDARMRKRAVPEDQRGQAPLVIGLGPNFTAGGNCDLAVETAWGERLGEVIEQGSTGAFAGEPKPVGGWGRERYVYAPVAGLFRTAFNIGDAVREGQIVARILTGSSETPIVAPKTGILRGLLRDGVEVAVGTKSVEVVPPGGKVFGVGERPARIAAGVVKAVRRRVGLLPLGRAVMAGVLRNAAAGELSLFASTLGLTQDEFRAMVETCLPGAASAAPGIDPAFTLCATQVPDLFDPLARMLFEFRAPDMAERPARWLALALAAACFGHRHLWQDLGLGGRTETTRLLALHFPALAAGNHADLKWKRYLFLTLGERLGRGPILPPGCADCDSHATCHGATHGLPGGSTSIPPRPASAGRFSMS